MWAPGEDLMRCKEGLSLFLGEQILEVSLLLRTLGIRETPFDSLKLGECDAPFALGNITYWRSSLLRSITAEESARSFSQETRSRSPLREVLSLSLKAVGFDLDLRLQKSETCRCDLCEPFS